MRRRKIKEGHDHQVETMNGLRLKDHIVSTQKIELNNIANC